MRSLLIIGGRETSRAGSPQAGRLSGYRAKRPAMCGGSCATRSLRAPLDGDPRAGLALVKQHRTAKPSRQIEGDRLISGSEPHASTGQLRVPKKILQNREVSNGD